MLCCAFCVVSYVTFLTKMSACLVTQFVVVCVMPMLCLSHANKSQIHITVFIENSVTYENNVSAS